MYCVLSKCVEITVVTNLLSVVTRICHDFGDKNRKYYSSKHRIGEYLRDTWPVKSKWRSKIYLY